MDYKRTFYTDILPRVQKPSQYLGNEWNSIHKDPSAVDLRICLVFPDLYELGLGNLGLHILYYILNQRDWIWAERGYMPAPDMEALLRSRGLPWVMHESKEPLNHADVIGFTLQTELTYTNILNALNLSGLALRSEARRDTDPLIIAGGPTSVNPEPLAPFIDCFVIGDGEEVVVELAEVLRPIRRAPRRERLEAVSSIQGVYVPSLYPMERDQYGQWVPPRDGKRITKRITRSLDTALFPTRYIVPFTQLVHDGVGLEVLRGCTQGCRFCQAGMVTRPVRERKIDTVSRLMAETLDSTGLDAVTLVSLSTCDYSRPRTLVKTAMQQARTAQASVSLPSLRLDSFAVEMADMVSGLRRSGLTFAPEAATPRLRAVINKFIPDEELLEMAAEAFKRGWTHIKTYFMIGLPTERDEDVLAIADLCIRALQVGRKYNPKARVRTGVSTFVPKPWTPFQFARQIDMEETRYKHELLLDRFRKYPAIKFGRHSPEASYIEGLISRADRRAADLIERAWQYGARLETWDEYLRIEPWLRAMDDLGYDAAFQLRERAVDERFPFDHIDVLVDRAWLEADWRRAMELKYAQDCRAGKCHLCGVIYRERDLCRYMLKNQKQGHAEEQENWEGVPRELPQEPAPKQRLRLHVGRVGAVRFLSHLEFMNAWVRILRRARIPLAYSQGFHAHPRVAFSTALPVGEESDAEYMDVWLRTPVDPEETLCRIREQLPEGFRLFAVREVDLSEPSLMSTVRAYEYVIRVQDPPRDLPAQIALLTSYTSDAVIGPTDDPFTASTVPTDGSEETQPAKNVRDLLRTITLAAYSEAEAEITYATAVKDGRYAKPQDILAFLGIPRDNAVVRKTATHFAPTLRAVPA